MTQACWLPLPSPPSWHGRIPGRLVPERSQCNYSTRHWLWMVAKSISHRDMIHLNQQTLWLRPWFHANGFCSHPQSHLERSFTGLDGVLGHPYTSKTPLLSMPLCSGNIGTGKPWKNMGMGENQSTRIWTAGSLVRESIYQTKPCWACPMFDHHSHMIPHLGHPVVPVYPFLVWEGP